MRQLTAYPLPAPPKLTMVLTGDLASVDLAQVFQMLAQDVLLACAADSATVLREFDLSGAGSGPLGIDGNVAVLPAPSGEIALFR